MLLFAYIFYNAFDGKLPNILRRPSLLLIAVVPFLPAYYLSFVAHKMEVKVDRYLADKSDSGVDAPDA